MLVTETLGRLELVNDELALVDGDPMDAAGGPTPPVSDVMEDMV